MRGLILLTSLSVGLLGVVCSTKQLKQEEAIRQLEGSLTVGMSRDEIQATLDKMGLHYVYAPRRLLEAMNQATFESTPLSGRIQVSLPPEKGFLFETVGHADIDLDERERMVSLRIKRFSRPR